MTYASTRECKDALIVRMPYRQSLENVHGVGNLFNRTQLS